MRVAAPTHHQLALLFIALAGGCGSINLNEGHDGAVPGGDSGSPTTITDGALAGTGGSRSDADAASADGGAGGTSSTTGVAGQDAAGASGLAGVGGQGWHHGCRWNHGLGRHRWNSRDDGSGRPPG